MKNIIYRIKKAFKLFWETLSTNEIDSKLFRRSLSAYFIYNESFSISICFTEVKVFETKDKYTIQITTHRPGILIGKGGQTIDDLIKWLNEDGFNKLVEIDLKESKMWHKLY